VTREDYGRITGYPEVVNYQLAADAVVLDIGGYLGDWTAALGNQGRTFIFEPVREFYEAIERRFEADSNITVLNVALSDTTGYDTMIVAKDGSHIADSDWEIETLDIVEFFKRYAIDKIDLASINIEGHEYTLVPRILESGLVNKIEHLQIQFHDKILGAFEGRNAIREQLALTHTESYCYPFVWESWAKK
jgi:FkbM family methyltransferase